MQSEPPINEQITSLLKKSASRRSRYEFCFNFYCDQIKDFRNDAVEVGFNSTLCFYVISGRHGTMWAHMGPHGPIVTPVSQPCQHGPFTLRGENYGGDLMNSEK